MKYVPSLPPVAAGAPEALDVHAMSGVKAAKPVQERTLPPLVMQRHAHSGAAPAELAGHPERRHDPHVQGERRTYCRRVEHLPVLVELRSGMERRHHTQRKGDATEHVDEQA